jgi:broad specificity phosphatase PhoE
MKTLCHVGGPSGGGKTTLANALQSDESLRGRISVRDLDEFDDEARVSMGFKAEEWSKNQWTDEMFADHCRRKQALLDAYVKKKNAESKVVVLVGHAYEAGNALDVHTVNLFMIDTGPLMAAIRGHIRDVPSGHRELLSLHSNYLANVDDVKELKDMGYQPRSHDWIVKWVRYQVNGGRNA